MPPRLIVRNTRKYGKGVFSKENIPKGQTVAVLGGEQIAHDELIERLINGDERLDDPLQIGLKTYIDLDPLSRAFNHSCNPNCGLQNKSKLFALRDIQQGEEITYDYSTTVAPTEWSMECKCGSTNCRKRIGSILTIPTKVLEGYQRAGALQGYMKRLLRTIKNNGGHYELPQYERDAIAKIRLMTKSGKCRARESTNLQ